jgi:phosphoribosylanthranilate isomerase
MVKIKVCGITNLADAEKALELGADALGFNFYPASPRCIAPERARAILRELPGSACHVALFVNETKERVREVLRFGQLEDGRQAFNSLQFHGEETADYCRGWGMKVIKAFRVKERKSLAGVAAFPADYYLLDSWSSGYGGSMEMAGGDRCGSTDSFRRAYDRQCRRCGSAHSPIRHRCVHRGGSPSRYQRSCKAQRIHPHG